MLRETSDKLIKKLRKDRRLVAEQCSGCENTLSIGDDTFDAEGNENTVVVCKIWWKPEIKFLNGRMCSVSTHLVLEDEKKEQQGKVRVGQQKQRRGR